MDGVDSEDDILTLVIECHSDVNDRCLDLELYLVALDLILSLPSLDCVNPSGHGSMGKAYPQCDGLDNFYCIIQSVTAEKAYGYANILEEPSYGRTPSCTSSAGREP